MTWESSWFGVIAGIAAIAFGCFAIYRPEAMQRWLRARGVEEAESEGDSRRRMRLVGSFFILAGAFWAIVALRKLLRST